MKKFVIMILLLFSFIIYAGAHENEALKEIYEQQFSLSGADKLTEALDHETVSSLEEIGISSPSWEEISKLNPEKIVNKLINSFREQTSSTFLSCFMPILSTVIICAVLGVAQDSFKIQSTSKIMDLVGTLCVCAVVIHPVVKCINHCAVIIKTASRFTLCAAPVMAGIMVAAGHPIAATSYQGLIIYAGQLISYFASDFLVPFMNIFLGISIISSISSGINLSGLCRAMCSFIKFALKFAATFFTGLLALQNLVSSAADSLSVNAMKFAVDNCVPIVGRAIGDAFTAVRGCVQLLKSGVGAFGIIAGALIFLPAIVECIIWSLFLNLSTGLSDVFTLKKLSALFKSALNVISVVFASLLCSLVILIISTVILLMIGR